MKTLTTWFEVTPGVMSSITALLLCVAVSQSALPKGELPNWDWLVRAIIGTTVWWFGLFYALRITSVIGNKRWRTVTLAVSVCVFLAHAVIIGYAAIMSHVDNPMWMLMADILDNQISFWFVLVRPLHFWMEVIMYVSIGGIWYVFCVIFLSRMVWLATSALVRRRL